MSLALKYYNELQEQIEQDAGGISVKMADSRVEVFLHFALYTICKIDYSRVGVIKKGRRIRKGSSGTRDATCDLDRVPASKRPSGPPLSQAVIIRYYDLSKTRKDWRSFYRSKFISINAVWSDDQKKFVTDFNEVVNEGLVPPPTLTLSMSEKRKLYKILKRKAA